MADKQKIEIDLDFSSIAILVCWVFICLWYWDHEADNRLATEWCLKTKACVAVPVYDEDGEIDEIEIRPAPKGDEKR